MNVRTRSAIIKDDITDAILEVPLYTPTEFVDGDLDTINFENIPKEGTRIYIKYINNEPYILGSCPELSSVKNIEDVKIRKKVTNINVGKDLLGGLVTAKLSHLDGYRKVEGDYFGSDDEIYLKSRAQSSNYAGNSFEDLMAGDKVLSTKDGNLIGVLEGGLTYFKASELCQIIGMKYEDLLRIISRNFQHYSDFGEIRLVNESGQTSYIIEGSSSYPESRDSNKHRLRIHMGAKGDLYRLAITDGSAKELFSFHVSNDGKLKIVNQGQETITYGDVKHIIHGTEDKEYVNPHATIYQKDYNKHIKANEIRIINENKVIGVGKYDTKTVGKDQTINIAGSKNEIIGGIQTLEDVAGSLDPTGTLYPEKDNYKQTLAFGNKVELIEAKGHFKREAKAGGFEYIGDGGDFELTIKEAGLLSKKGGNYKINVNDNVKWEVDPDGNYKWENPKVKIDIDEDGNLDWGNELVKLKVEKDGNIQLDNGKVTIKVNKDGSVEITAEDKIDITSPNITLTTSGGSVEKMVLGEKLRALIKKMIKIFNEHKHSHPYGTTISVLNKWLMSYDEILSQNHKND
ncbi:MAG: hypothetical protein ACTSPI_00200 [Candidatus Heimdallarchaeaceae archaeon]